MFKKLDEILGIKNSKKDFENAEQKLSLAPGQFKYYVENNILPSVSELISIQKVFGVSPSDLKIQMGKSDLNLRLRLSGIESGINMTEKECELKLQTEYGKLYQGDCLALLKSLPDNSIDLIFADPPFNLNKSYKSDINDNLSGWNYLKWCEDWLEQCIRVLKFHGSLYVWNLPKWNTYISSFLNDRLTFKNWIATDIKFSLPISGRLYPSHYSLLYYIKGDKPKTFKPDRLPLEVCRKCFSEIKDYGGYKSKLNKAGMNISDIWTDIPPVRHRSLKRREGANELSVKLLDRVIQMSSTENDIIFDPFGGSGTTYAVAEIKKRKWIGVELGPVDEIIQRFENLEQDAELIRKYRENLNHLFPKQIKIKRKKSGLWTDETFSKIVQLPTNGEDLR